MHLRLRKLKPKSQPSYQIERYPAGTYVQTERGYFYILSDKKRLPISTKRCLDSWNPIRLVQSSEDHRAISSLIIGLPLKFRNGSLLYSQASGKMYLISQGALRHVTNPDVLSALGFRGREAVAVSLDEINLHEKGEPLNG